jgi:uncharacterized membrane protein
MESEGRILMISNHLSGHGKKIVWNVLVLALLLMLVSSLAVTAESTDTTTPGATTPGTTTATVAGAPETFEISTPYSGLTCKAGDNLNFNVALANAYKTSKDAALTVAAIPDKWTGYFSAKNTKITAAHIPALTTDSSVTFALGIPLDAADGQYTVTLKADCGNGVSDTTDIVLNVNSEEVGNSSFKADYPSQEGDATTAFSFNATLINNMLSQQTYSFTSKAPDCWKVAVKPGTDTTQIASIAVEPRASQALSVSVTPPEDVNAGKYDITVTATSASESLPIDLKVTITGNYKIKLDTPSGLLSYDAYAKKETPIVLQISNPGNTDLTNVTLSAQMPDGWTARFDPSTIDLLQTGSNVQATVYVTPGSDVIAGDYTFSLTAKTSQASSSQDFRVTIKTPTTWGYVGIGIIAVLVIGLILVFRRFGRR